jgi:hypothetical protein
MTALRAFVAWIRRFLERRRVRALLADPAPRGLLPGAEALRTSVRVPPLPLPLVRVAAPPPPRDLGLARVAVFDRDRDPPPERRSIDHAWVLASLRREKIDLPWMARSRLLGLAPLAVEWFALWWEQTARAAPGAAAPRPWPVPEDLSWRLDQVKEQMLIRRDVVKDEEPPRDGAFQLSQSGPRIAIHAPPPVPDLVPAKEWVEVFRMPFPPAPARPAREAYLEWRTVIDAAVGDGR